MATVVAKLFGIVGPERAYFGQKDGQQTVVVRKLARDLDMGIEIVVLPTVRETDGLAMSSRNVRLSPGAAQGRRSGLPGVAFRHGPVERGGAERAPGHRRQSVEVLEEEPLLGGCDYVSLAATDTLEELEQAEPGAMLSTAVHLGPIRLIDNLILE